MAADWIKVCKDTPNKPELLLVSKLIQQPRSESFLLWFSLYCWADAQTKDGFLPHLTLADVAELSGVSLDFCIALGTEGVRWMFPTESTKSRPAGIQFAKWDRHNGDCAKKRADAARRQQKSRAIAASLAKRNGSVTK